MQDDSARVRGLKLAAATTIFSVATVATATPTAIHSAAEQALLATLQSNALTPELEPGSIKIGEPVDTVRIRSPKGDLARIRQVSFSSVEELPPSGSIATFGITDPRDAAEPTLAFEPPRTAAVPTELSYSRFAKGAAEPPATTVVKRLPERNPDSSPAQDSRHHAVETTTVLAYAPATANLEAPFDALMGGATAENRPSDGRFVPRPRPGILAMEDWLDGRSPKQFEPNQHSWVQNPLPESVYEVKQQRCLAEGIYFEARGEPELGQAAVAQVILNRVRAPAYPDTICEVVYQNKSWRNRCQFSFACDGVPNLVLSSAAWRRAVDVAWKVTEGEVWLEDVGDSTNYHANYVRPGWGEEMIEVDRIGAHIFYRTRFGGWS